MAVFIWAYVYLLLNNPDALRSESFILKRTALEHRMIGDSIHGVIQSSDRQGSEEAEPLLTTAEHDSET